MYQNDKILLSDRVLPNEELLAYINEHKDYALCGDTSNLGLESDKFDIIANLAKGKKEENKVENIFTLNPTYLKELTK